ncbi:MAG: very short patch repair endonuclease [Candidatus Abyssobacteria bacterium SURF_5]|uniref:Very short patch repair endonuclease n=1 Tax=Abyssobacteria bacterium (strain SURF_5) TaxID=2093360 RepID=A0A3A4NFB6_ABYX5|nr:MAG: very short patch repair endonuclease [Candidatus Abyssubacteria bacterium SURF_5]
MVDIFSPQKRSWIMSRVRGTNTRSEKKVFSHLRKEGIYFQKHYRRAPGNPDVALPRKKLCVFIDGDFWHGRRIKETSDKLPPFWREKILTNIRRDIRNKRKLRKLGWKTMRVWESDLKKKPEKTLEKIVDFLSER